MSANFCFPNTKYPMGMRNYAYVVQRQKNKTSTTNVVKAWAGYGLDFLLVPCPAPIYIYKDLP